MDAFESIVAIYLDSLGYWVKQSVKVDIGIEGKRKIGTHSMPTPEIDLVAFNSTKNELILIEVKSFLDSGGVEFGGLSGGSEKTRKRYRLLNDPTFQKVITQKLLESFVKSKFINNSTTVKYALAAGKVYEKDYEKVKKHLKMKGYCFYCPSGIENTILNLKGSVYLNDSVTMTVKLLRKHFIQTT